MGEHSAAIYDGKSDLLCYAVLTVPVLQRTQADEHGNAATQEALQDQLALLLELLLCYVLSKSALYHHVSLVLKQP